MRIIGGKYRGKKLIYFNLENVRPTSDIVREALFNSLQADVRGSVFLDLFGGTGAVGLEAYSRGADSVHIVEADKKTAGLIIKNLESLGGSNCQSNGMPKATSLTDLNDVTVTISDYTKALTKFSVGGVVFDIVFIDPPYNKGLEVKAVQMVVDLKLINEDSIVVVETDKKLDFKIPSELVEYNKRVYGTKCLRFLQLASENYE